MLRDIPFVGRGAELDRIVSRLEQDEPAAFVLAGPAGVGKTRLAAEVAGAAGSRGYSTALVVATRAASSIPFGSFAPLLPDAVMAADDRLELLRRTSAAVVERAGAGGRLLLVVDDAHLLDDGSAALVHQLVQGGSCSLLASVRTPTEMPDSVIALWKDGLAERLDLEPLGEAEVERFAALTLGGPVAGSVVRRLWEASRGNALYLRELLRGAVESGAVAHDGGVWMLHHPIVAPGRLVELVSTRLEGLPASTTEVLDYLAIGEPMALHVLEGMTSSAALEEAEERGLVEVNVRADPTEVRLTHPIYADALRQRLPQSRTRRIWVVLADALEGTGTQRREDLLRIAKWRLDAHVGGDPDLFTQAARSAREMFDVQLAVRLAGAAVDSGGGVDAGFALGEAEMLSGRHEEAERVLASLVPHCSSDSERAQVASARSYNRSVLMGDPAGAERIIDEALSVVEQPSARLQLRGRTAMIKLMSGEPRNALSAATDLLESPDPGVLLRGTWVSSIALAMLGRTEVSVREARRGLEFARTQAAGTQLPETQVIGAVLALSAAGRLAEAEDDSTAAYQAALGANDREGQATFSLLLGRVRVEQGRLAAASLAFREAAAINRELHETGALRWCAGGIALAEGMIGNDEAATAALAELDGLRADWMMIFEPDLVDRGRAWALVAGGAVSSACQQLRSAADRAAAVENWVAEARLLHDLARLGDPRGASTRLSELAEVIDGALVHVMAAHAAALVGGAGDGLEAVSQRFDELGAALLAAEAATAAATALKAEGSSRRSTACARRAAELVQACGFPHTPGLTSHVGVGRLSKRELEVAGLAVRGKTNREIAEGLFVSVRTVQNHLQNVYGKLGVSNRDELARVFTPS